MKNLAQLYSEMVQYCCYHRDPSILIVKNQENKELQRNNIGGIKGTTIDTAC